MGGPPPPYGLTLTHSVQRRLAVGACLCVSCVGRAPCVGRSLCVSGALCVGRSLVGPSPLWLLGSFEAVFDLCFCGLALNWDWQLLSVIDIETAD